jgi:hypothetical protein
MQLMAWTLRPEHNSNSNMIGSIKGKQQTQRGSMQVRAGVNQANVVEISQRPVSDGGSLCCSVLIATARYGYGDSQFRGRSRSWGILQTATAVCAAHAV